MSLKQSKTATAAENIRLLAITLIASTLTGCSGHLGYYWNNAQGHLAIVQAAKPVQDWLDDAQTPAPLKAKLALAQRIRSFASQELALPNNASYTRFADLKRAAVVWNVVAAPQYSLQLHTWCFAVVGCVGYRGYYSEAAAQEEASRLQAQGLEVSVYGVPAYSTLGYLNWIGGDPLLSTFITYPEGELARMIFHELAHQVLYVGDDTAFNESFATAVERIGGRLWLTQHASAAAQAEYAQFDERRKAFRALTLRSRQALDAIYKQNRTLAAENTAPSATNNIANNESLETQKQAAMQALRSDYASLKASWNGYAGYDRFIAQANNASLGAQGAYEDLVPQFEAVFKKRGNNFKAFYDAIQSITPLPKDQRRQALAALSQSAP